MQQLEKRVIDYTFAMRMKPYLERFTVKKNQPLLVTCRCPYCGDSVKDKTKTRGYIIEQSNGRFYFYCHNCRINVQLQKLMEDQAPSLYGSYRYERLKLQRTEDETFKETTSESTISVQQLFDNYLPVSELLPTESVRKYLINRMIPTKMFQYLYYVDDIAKLLMQTDPEKATTFPKGQARLVIPYIAEDKTTVISYTARTLDAAIQPRYISTVVNKTLPNVFGLNLVDWRETVYVFEGAFDAMLAPNALAIGGSHATNLFELYMQPYKHNIVFVYDNEPRNINTIKQLQKALSLGYKILVWPCGFSSKDLNEMICNGEVRKDAVKDLLTHNIHTGLSGLAAIANWRRI